MNNTIAADNHDLVVCASCGKGDEGCELRTCTACKLVKYCNRDCQIAHRPQHKKECKKRAKELHEEDLFKQPPPKDDCPICMLPLPFLIKASTYMSCCGKTICNGCTYAPVYDDKGKVINEKKCPFCRTPIPTSEEELIEMYNKRMKLDDAEAINDLGCFYCHGMAGLPQDYDKAFGLWKRAGELGCTQAYFHIGCSYDIGTGVEKDEKKAKHYFELAAIGGNASARYNIGLFDETLGKMNIALNHYMVAVRSGNENALKRIKQLFSNGHATKNDYTKALFAYQVYLDAIRSVQRDEARTQHDEDAISDNYSYY